MKRREPDEAPVFFEGDEDDDLPDFLLVDKYPNQRNTARFQLPQSLLLGGVSVKSEFDDPHIKSEPNEKLSNSEYIKNEVVKEEPAENNYTIADEIENDLYVVIQNVERKETFGSVVWDLQKCVTKMKEHMREIKKVDFSHLSNAIIEVLALLFKKAVDDNLSYEPSGIKEVEKLYYASKDVSEFDIFKREQADQIDNLLAKINSILPSFQTDEIANQKELRSYLEDQALDTTRILIQLCDPKDLDSFLKAVGDLQIIFTPTKHKKTNYAQMIKELNGLPDNDGRNLATPFFLIKKAFENSVIKKQFEELVKVLSQAIRDEGNFFTEKQIPEIDKMLNQCHNFSKSKPQKLGRKLHLKKDEEVMRFKYVQEYIAKHPDYNN